MLDDAKLNFELDAYQNCLRLTRRCVAALDKTGRGDYGIFAQNAVASLAGVSTFLDTTNVSIEQQRWTDLLPILKKALQMKPPAESWNDKMNGTPRVQNAHDRKFLKIEALRVLSTFVRNTEGNREEMSKQFLEELQIMIRAIGCSTKAIDSAVPCKSPTLSVHWGTRSLQKSLGALFAKWFVRPSDELLQKLTIETVPFYS